MRLLGPFLAAALCASSATLAAQSVTTIPSSVSCTACKVSLQRVTTIGLNGDSIALTRRTKLAVDGRRRFYAARTYTQSAIAMYDSSGRLLRVFGQPGEGPGEFRGEFSHLLIGPGDSVHVIENTDHSVLAPGLGQFVRRQKLAIPGYSAQVLRSNRLLVQRTLLGTWGTAQPLHLLDPSGEVFRSFGAPAGAAPPKDVWEQLRQFAVSRSGEVWVGYPTQYRIELWHADRGLQRTLVRDASWFPSWAGYDRREPRYQAPRPVLVHLHEDSDGYLWTVVQVADRNWKADTARGEATVGESDRNLLWDSIIEVIDPRSGRVLGRTRIDAIVEPVSGDSSLLSTHREAPSGDIVIDVWRLRFESPSTRR